MINRDQTSGSNVVGRFGHFIAEHLQYYLLYALCAYRYRTTYDKCKQMKFHYRLCIVKKSFFKPSNWEYTYVDQRHYI